MDIHHVLNQTVGVRVRLKLLAVAAAAVWLVVAGCGGPKPDLARTPTTTCLPSRPTVEPNTVRAGGSVTVASTGFEGCGSYPAPRTYSMTLGTVGRQAPADLGNVAAAADGTFSATVMIPAGTSPGEAYIIFQGSAWDECKDTDNGASCAGYDTPAITVTPL